VALKGLQRPVYAPFIVAAAILAGVGDARFQGLCRWDYLKGVASKAEEATCFDHLGHVAIGTAHRCGGTGDMGTSLVSANLAHAGDMALGADRTAITKGRTFFVVTVWLVAGDAGDPKTDVIQIGFGIGRCVAVLR